MADRQISNRQMFSYKVSPDGPVDNLSFDTDHEGVSMSVDPVLLASKGLPDDGLTALAIPDDDFVSDEDVIIEVTGIGRDNKPLSETKTLSVVGVGVDNRATALNLTEGDVFDK